MLSCPPVLSAREILPTHILEKSIKCKALKLTSSPKVFFPRQTTKGTSSLSGNTHYEPSTKVLLHGPCLKSSGSNLCLSNLSGVWTWPEQLSPIRMIIAHPQVDLCPKTWSDYTYPISHWNTRSVLLRTHQTRKADIDQKQRMVIALPQILWRHLLAAPCSHSLASSQILWRGEDEYNVTANSCQCRFLEIWRSRYPPAK